MPQPYITPKCSSLEAFTHHEQILRQSSTGRLIECVFLEITILNAYWKGICSCSCCPGCTYIHMAYSGVSGQMVFGFVHRQTHTKFQSQELSKGWHQSLALWCYIVKSKRERHVDSKRSRGLTWNNKFCLLSFCKHVVKLIKQFSCYS